MRSNLKYEDTPKTASAVMRILRDQPIPMEDGIVLRADLYLPDDEEQHPVLLSYGPYGKDLSFQEGYPIQWAHLLEVAPEVKSRTSNAFQSWEVADPEVWVAEGYVCVRVDCRGSGRSPGLLNPWSSQETADLYECIEWAGTQEWSNGRVGLSGISYYAMNQYQVAALEPPHLTAICPWEGASDWYREFSRHGGILSTFAADWYPRQVELVQHGIGERGFREAHSNGWVAGPETLTSEELAAQRVDLAAEVGSRHTISDWHLERNPDWSKVKVPLLSAGNWGGHGLHLRGNVEAFTSAVTEQKWLEIHGRAHWVDFYSDYGVELQKRFFGHFLKGEETGWDQQPRVQLNIRQIDGSLSRRAEREWPLARTKWTRMHLDLSDLTLSESPVAEERRFEYDPLGSGVTFTTEPFREATELTGPMSAKLYVSSESTDADIFVIVGVMDPAGNEVTFMGALDPNTPLGQGWLRASHRKLDQERSLPYRPYHTHDEVMPLTPRRVYELNIEIWPTCIVIPPSCCFTFTVKGNDYRYKGDLSPFAEEFHYANRGIGPFVHDDPSDRPSEIFGAPVTIVAGGAFESFVLLPVIPS